MDRHVMGDQVTVADQLVVLDRHVTQVASDGGQDQFPTVPPLRAGRVIDHVRGDQFLYCRLIAGSTPLKEFLDDLSGGSSPPVLEFHRTIMPTQR
jgi:hypothetical protein